MLPSSSLLTCPAQPQARPDVNAHAAAATTSQTAATALTPAHFLTEPTPMAPASGDIRVALKAAEQAEVARGGLTRIWRERAIGKKQKQQECAPTSSHADVAKNMLRWFQLRELNVHLEARPDVPGLDEGRWQFYRRRDYTPFTSGSKVHTAYHGTWFYALWALLESGCLLESTDTACGHEVWTPGAP